MSPDARIVRASSLRPGLATVVLVLPNKTIRSCVAMIDARETHVQIAFMSGDIVSLPANAVVGVVDTPRRRERLAHAVATKQRPPWLRGAT